MPTEMSAFGFVHTAVSVLPIGFGLVALAQDGCIDITQRAGRAYFITMLLGCATGFVIFAHGGFSVGHLLTLIMLALLLTGAFARRIRWLGRTAPYIETASLTSTFFLLIVFATTEGLTRLPPGHPYASGPVAAELVPVRLVLLSAFLIGLGWQLNRLRQAQTRSKTTSK
jgi:hypothetical protein